MIILQQQDMKRFITNKTITFTPNDPENNTGKHATRMPENIYHFHPNHLGTGTLITDVTGEVYQFFLNLPYGETMIEQGGYDYDNPYKFNGKELDQETGLYYYGARYYDPETSIFLSVDPLAEKYYFQNPYVYANSNPTTLMDINGMGTDDEWIIFSTGETVRIGDKGGDTTDYIHRVDENGNITTEVVDVQKSFVSVTGTEIPTLIDKSPSKRVYDATSPAIKQTCLPLLASDLLIEGISDYTGLDENVVALAAVFINPKNALKSGINLLKEGSKGASLAKKLMKFGEGGRLPNPRTAQNQFEQVKGVWRHKETGTIFKKSYTSHGNPGNTGTQWKIWPKGTKDFGKVSKTTGRRITIDYDGNIIGH